MRPFLVLSLLFCWVLPLKGQQYITQIEQYTQKDGLSHNTVNWIRKDQKGIIWLGTKDGISRFDGYTFEKVSDLAGSKPMRTSLFEDQDGDIWLRKNNIVFLFNKETTAVKPFSVKFPNVSNFDSTAIIHVEESKTGQLFLGTKKGNLLVEQANGEFEVIKRSSGKPAYPFGLTPKGYLWFWEDYRNPPEEDWSSELLLLDENQEVLQRFELWAFQSFVAQKADGTAIVQTPDSILYLHTDGKKEGFAIPRHKFYETPANWGWSFERIRYDAAQDHFWHIQLNNIYVFDEQGVKHFLSEEHPLLSLPHAGKPLIDREFLWMGSVNGLIKIKCEQNPFEHLFAIPTNEPPSIPSKQASCRGIAEGPDGQIYTMRQHWLSVYSPQRKTSEEYPLGETYFYDLHVQDEQTILAMEENHLLKVNPQTNHAQEVSISYRNKKPVVSWSMEEINDRLWISLPDRMGAYNPQTNSVDKLFDLPVSQVYAIFQDRDHRIWLASSEGLVLCHEEKGVLAIYGEKEDKEHYLPATEYHHIQQDEEGVFWLSTDKGLIRWEEQLGAFRLFTTEDGLPHNNIYAVYEDVVTNGLNFLWMSTDKGLAQLEKETWKVRNYQVEDGITHQEFNRISHLKDSKGQFYFGGLNGITVVDPKKFRSVFTEHINIPLSLITCELFSHESQQLEDRLAVFKQEGEIVMSPEDRYLNIQIALLDYDRPDQVQYSYRIASDDHANINTWQPVKGNNIQITVLPYGRHQVQVNARNANGLYSAQILSIPIYVPKPFYLRTWFIALVAFAALIILFFMQKLKTKYLVLRQKELEEMVKERTATIEAQKEELLKMDQAKSRFLANISHEFRTPLTLILNTIEGPKLFREQNNGILRRNAHRLKQLIDQLLDLSKIEAGKIEVDLTPGDIKTYLKELVHSFQPLAQNQNIHLNFIAVPANYHILFDRDKMDKIFYNLLSNALKFTPRDGQVMILLDKKGNEVFAEVIDTGIGIPAEELPYIFNRFHQVKQTDEYAYEGSGIGLALVYELVRVHHGEIKVSSQLGEGTKFQVKFTVEETEDEIKEHGKVDDIGPFVSEVSLASFPESPRQAPLLLIIEDNEDLRYHQQLTFSKDYKILLAKDGLEGLDLAFEHQPDIILSDVMMPGKSGYELCEHLKTDERTNHIPLVLLTAKTGQEDRIEGLQKGADAYLSKPYHPEELRLTLSNLLKQAKHLQNRFFKLATHAATSPEPELKDTPQHLFLQKVTSIIDERLSDPQLSVDSLAVELNLSRSHLSRKVKTISGQTASQLIRSYRLQKAKQLLADVELTGAEIAYQVGFNDPDYFYKCFKKEFGVTVGEMRG